jgi:putative nucleotidyltransferase with HDIG domain
VRALTSAVSARDGVTGHHVARVCALGVLLAEHVAPREAGNPQLAWGLLLHDLGKLAVPDAVLLKPGRLDPGEAEVMRGHAETGAQMLEELACLGRSVDVVRHHHERWDGGGYPHGICGARIPLWARITAVADAVDAMTSDRPYRAARSLGEALEVVREEAGGQFDPHIADRFLRLDRGRVAALLEDPASDPAAGTARELLAA